MLNILYLEDSIRDVEIICELLHDSGFELNLDYTATETGFVSFLHEKKYDIILSDYHLPGFDGFGALRLATQLCPDIPFICISGIIGEETAIELLKQGAVDYILKDRLVRLPIAINLAMEKAKEKEALKLSIEALHASENRYRRLFESAKDGILIVDTVTGNIIEVNKFLIELLGYSSEKFLGKAIWELPLFANAFKDKENFFEMQENEYLRFDNMILETAAGQKLDVEFISNVYMANNQKIIQCNIRDISKRVKAEKRQLLTTRILTILNKNKEWESLVRNILEEVKAFTSFDAIGIRLKEDEDYPYFETIGFDSKFVELERTLCSKNLNGDIIYSSDKKPILECLCGSVISCKTDSRFEFFTKGGSFWTNSMSEFSAKTTKLEIFKELRNRCNKVGYESVALISLHSGEEVIGLLQLNDKRTYRFTPDLIEFFEEIGKTIGIAFKRSQIEKKIRISEQRFSDMFENAPVGYHELDFEGRIMQINQTELDMLGYEREEMVGSFVWDFIDDIELSRDRVLSKLKGISPPNVGIERKYLKKDNSSIYLLIEDRILKDENGHIIGMRTALQNISAKKQSEEELKQSHDRLFKLSEQVSGVIYQYRLYPDGHSCFPYSSSGMNDIYEYSPDDVREDASPVFGRLHPDDYQHVSELIFESARTLEHFYCEYRVVLPRQGLRWRFSDAIPERTEDNGTLWHGIIYDITERKNAEEEIRMNVLRLQSLVEIFQHEALDVQEFLDYSLEQTILMTKSKIGYIYYYNEEKQEFTLNTWSKDVMPECSVVEPQTIYQLSKTGLWGEAVRQRKAIVVNDFEAPDLLKKGYPTGHVHLKKYLTIPLFSGDKIVAVFAVANKPTDYTETDILQITLLMDAVWKVVERKRVEKEVIEAKEKAEESYKVKSNFLANMSHELRTPLIGILGYSEVLSEVLENQEYLDMAKAINTSGERLKTTLNMILKLSKVEAKQVDLSIKKLDIIPLVNKYVDLYAGTANRTSLYIKMIIKAERLYANIDTRLFEDIVNNILKNAFVYTKEGGMTIILFREELNGKSFSCFSIEDTGIGIAEKDFKMIFDEFRQASEGHGRNFEGTGLGLTLTKKYVDLMNGELFLESKLGVGSKFTVRFPYLESDAELKQVAVFKQSLKMEESVESENLPVILFVENDDTCKTVMEEFLNTVCKIIITDSGSEAIEIASSGKFDCILMDINLGSEMDGLEVTKELRKLPQYAQTPIIAVTAFAMDGDREEFIEAGCTDYISKPFKKHEIIDIVMKNLHK